MNVSKWTWLVFVALAVIAQRSIAQRSAAPRVTAQLSTGVVKLGEPLALTVSVENSTTAQIGEAPSVEGLSIEPFGRPSRRESTTYRNGRITSELSISWSAVVRPARVGEFTIPPIAIATGGQVHQTQPLALTVVADLQGDELGFIQVSPSSTRVVDGQPFSIEIRFGWDARKQEFNFGVLSLPWWDQLPGTVDVAAPAPERKVEDAIVMINNQSYANAEPLGEIDVDGRSVRAFRIRRTYTPTKSGSIDIGKSFLEFGRAVARRDFFDTRYEKAESFYASADPVRIEVVPLPEQGRPLDFGGAIGSLSVRASAEPRDVSVGESIKLTVEWTGQGNLEFFEPPDPSRQDAFQGFHVYGRSESKDFGRRTVVYDLAPQSETLREIPPLSTPVFDPSSMEYGEIRTTPIAIRVRALADARSLDGGSASQAPAAQARDLVDIDARATPRGGGSGPGGAWVLGTLLFAGVGGAAVRVVVRRRGDPSAPIEKRRRRARKELERALAKASDARARLDAFVEFLAARSREPREAWVGRDPRIEDGAALAKLDRSTREELARALADLERAAWGGGQADVDARALATVADRAIAGGL